MGEEAAVADVIRFVRSEPVQPSGKAAWRRFPRFEEVGQQIDAQARKLLDVAGSQTRYTELYARVEQRLREDDRPLLRELFEAITHHHERFEHAAYIVGLQAGHGTLPGLPPVLDDDRTEGDDGPKRA
jgi:hypothetical protein